MRDRFHRNPVTAGYLSAVAGLALLMRFVFADGMSAQVRESLSTNADNLADHPVNALLGSAFVLDPVGDGLVTTGLALVVVAVCLGVLEREVGPWRAVAVALFGHVGATLVTALVISSGVYPFDLTDVIDVGAGYVAFTAAGAITVLAPAVLRAPWLALLVAYPLMSAEWFGAVPEFAAVGHVAAVLFGLCGGGFAVSRAYAAVGR
ncbi:rhomboid-like protein [Saccharothrix deserti]|uniref:rhomboid-like protein n=1 Tax=Saccharothrix deserti TaxID=2593674 RepID=UPI00131B032B|nr:rhomboid-like protein [Saccharothrix deserti]